MRDAVFSSTCNDDVIIITVKWFNLNFIDDELQLRDHTIFGVDKDPLVSGRWRGGGVLIAIRDGY